MSRSRKSIEEINQIPPELPDISAKEFAPLPDEFNRGETTAKPKGKPSSSLRKIMLYLASIGLVTLGVITPIIRVKPPEDVVTVASVMPTSTPTAAQEAETVFTQIATIRPTVAPTPAQTEAPTEAPSPAPTSTQTPTPTPTPMPTPRMTGQIHITIYSDVYDFGTAMRGLYPSTVLADETIPAESFREYTLPPLPLQNGYKALGYVLLKSSGEAYLEGLSKENAEPAPIGTVALTKKLTADDLDIVPQDVHGVYNAEIHVVWLTEESDYHLEFYDGNELLDDYFVGFPIESEQLCYLAPFPIPTRPGKTFVGWQNVDGFMVDAVTYFDFFEKLPDAKTIEDRDLSKHMPCKVYACWSDGSGGVPEPTPKPTPTPRPTPTRKPTPKPTSTPIYYTVSCYNCTFSGGGYSRATSGSVQKGTTITIYGSSDSSAAYFVGTPSAAGRGSYGNPLSPYSAATPAPGHIYYTYYFRYSYTVTGNTHIEFYAIIN